ncbi:SAM-dependent methyltransferase [Actinomadura scrupuli]|uniref:SAM-dependent methyltransferase n=1 Tax=Actinomadura scrupuli TaxID=559629 RepID=UPI003D982689
MAESNRPRIDVTVPNVARMYDYYLGGKDNFAADREAAAKVLEVAPFAPRLARQNRGFMARAVRYLAGIGITQFLDIGAGLPTQGNVHEVARQILPGARVVYLDNDPVVVTHGRALLGVDQSTVVLERDLRESAGLLDDPKIRELIRPGEPVGLLLVAVLHCLDADDEPYRVMTDLRKSLPPGSHVVISHITGDDEVTANSSTVYRKASTALTHRTPEEILGFFDGFGLLEPGLVSLDRWRPDDTSAPAPVTASGYFLCGVGRKES